MKLMERFVEKFFESEMKWEYKLQDEVIRVGKQRFKRTFPDVLFGQIGEVPVKANGKKVICPIYYAKDGLCFVFRNEKILFNNLKRIS